MAEKRKMQIAYELIKEMILSGELKEGEIINEEELQKKFDIGRTPIREAIKILDMERHVVVFARKGTIVSSINVKLINNVYQVREVIEPYAVKIACEKLSKEILEEMKEKFMAINANYSFAEYATVDREFHTLLIRCIDNMILEDAMRITSDHDQRLRINNFYSEKNAVLEHVEIIEAMLAQNVQLAEKLMIKHIRRAKEISLECIFK